MFGSIWRYGEIAEVTMAENKERRKNPQSSIILTTDLARADETLRGALPAFSDNFPGLRIDFKVPRIKDRKIVVLEQLAANIGKLAEIIVEERDKPDPHIVRGRDGYNVLEDKGFV